MPDPFVSEVRKLQADKAELVRVCKVQVEVIAENEDRIEQLQAQVEALRPLVQCLLDNDPMEPIADNGMTVLDQWRKDARAALAAREDDDA